MSRRRRQRTQMAAMDQINVTPLLDLTFLLLIAFMITMPLMEYGTNVDPPEMNGDPLPTENIVSVSLTRDGTYMLDSETVSKQDLESQLRTLSRREPRPQLLVRGDGERTFNSIIDLLKLARDCGFEDATLATQQEANPR